MTEVVRLERVSRRFPGATPVLEDVDLVVRAGELVAVVGASGSGKSTLLSVMGALDGDFAGRVALHGAELGGLSEDQRSTLRSQQVGFVFQSFHLLDHLSVLENVMVPLWLLPAPPNRDEARARAAAWLGRVGLEGRSAGRIGPLSGGERQRVAIARALVHGPSLVLADEPTGNLDQETAEGVFALFEAARRDAGRAVVVVTHDRRMAARADRVLRLSGGKLVEEAA